MPFFSAGELVWNRLKSTGPLAVRYVLESCQEVMGHCVNEALVTNGVREGVGCEDGVISGLEAAFVHGDSCEHITDAFVVV